MHRHMIEYLDRVLNILVIYITQISADIAFRYLFLRSDLISFLLFQKVIRKIVFKMIFITEQAQMFSWGRIL